MRSSSATEVGLRIAPSTRGKLPALVSSTAMKELQEAVVVLNDIEKKRRRKVRTESDKSRIRSEELRLKTEKNLAEISEKLNRLIGPR
jgi:hypothetical protein